jgi:hypothetical protein
MIKKRIGEQIDDQSVLWSEPSSRDCLSKNHFLQALLKYACMESLFTMSEQGWYSQVVEW